MRLLGSTARKQRTELIARAIPLHGDFFRSVAFRYFHPDVLISGEGTRLNGGRSQIAVGEYPRTTYVLSVATTRNLDLAARLPSELAKVVRLCLRMRGHSASQELAAIWISEDIDSVVFPSATGAGRNVAVYLANAASGSVVVRNRDVVLAALRRPRARKRGR